ncbi:MAG: efflux RND transporter permease subunit, partial [Burkholderiaceae bacterium]|nr:efflux RND transporter permease subunit [Burkholderiaceae bacterium]
MINLLIQLCFKRRQLIWVIAALLTAYGYFCWVNMTVEAYPEIGDVTTVVTTQVPGLAAEEVEQQITIPLERALRNTPGLVTIRSSSTFALSLITLVFKDGTEDYFANQRVLERIGTVTLPPGITPGLGPVSGPGGEILRYTLESDSRNLMELSEIQRWIVVPALKEVSGVVDVTNFGGFTKEFQLEVDPVKLAQFGLTLQDVISAINANSVNAGGGRVVR